MSQVIKEITLDETHYKWVHNNCRCVGHCSTDELYINGELEGSFESGDLCRFVTAMMEALNVDINQ